MKEKIILESKNSCWIENNNLYKVLVQENLKIKFESQAEKIQEFKKLKRPIEIKKSAKQSLNPSILIENEKN